MRTVITVAAAEMEITAGVEMVIEMETMAKTETIVEAEAVEVTETINAMEIRKRVPSAIHIRKTPEEDVSEK